MPYFMAAPAPLTGKTISHFRIAGKLGAGGMGEVYRAADLKLQRDMALKFLPAELAADEQARERLVKEARAASRLNHPNIATIYEVDEADGVPFIAMELVQGESLRDILRRRPIAPAQLLDIARQIAEGLQEAHQGGVLHRDIKPANIMLDARGRVKILDFGLAAMAVVERAPDEAEDQFISRTATHWSTGGTVPYMSPEQLRGQGTDERSDIFSFGALLYECLTGRLPFPGETAIDIMQAILRKPPTPLRTLLADISADWEQLVQRCLAKSPEQRPRSMGEVLSDLKRVSAPAERQEKLLAVLYFENLSGSKEEEYFRDGITEDLITELLKIKELRVFPRSAVTAYRDKKIGAPQVGRELNAAYVLEGSVRRAGNHLRLNAQLVDASTGHGMWAERYDRQMEDVFAIQDEIVQSIAKALKLMLTEKEKRALEKRPTDIQAYDHYLRGRQYFHQFRKKSFDFARQMFARAIIIDPNFARAYAGVADCCSFLYQYWDANEVNLKEADAASRKALELDPELAEAHASRGLALSLSKRYDEAKTEFEMALRLNPKLFEAYYFYARSRFAEGKLEDATRLYEEASRINPDDYQTPCLVGSVYNALGEREKAEKARRTGLQVIEKHLEMHPDDARALYLGAICLGQFGQRERALEWTRRALAADPEDSGVLYNVACCFAILGEKEEAIKCLEKAVVCGFGHKAWLVHDADLDSVRELPRFQTLLAKMP